MAYGCLHLVADGPWTAVQPAPFWDPEWTYCEIQRLDPWPGDCDNPQYDGGAVRSGFKLLRREGIIGSYWWARTVDDVVDALLAVGPVGLGIGWLSGMLSTDVDGFVSVSGRDIGGHFVILDGANREQGKVRGKNSWGRRWGDEGFFWMTFDGLADRLADRGEAGVAVYQA